MKFVPGEIVRLKSARHGEDMIVVESNRHDNAVVCRWNEGRDKAAFDAKALRLVDD